MKTTSELSDLPVPFGRVGKFVRQLTHDVRNGLSAIDLEAAFIAELISDPEAADEVRKLREMVANTAAMLKAVSVSFQPVTAHKVEWPVKVIFEELRSRLPRAFPEEAGRVELDWRPNGEVVEVDMDLIFEALFVLLRNAFQFREEGAQIRLSCSVEEAWMRLEVSEEKKELNLEEPLEEWGTHPLRTTHPGGYGLGLLRARQIVAVHEGKLEREYQAGRLISRILLQVAVAQ